MTTRICVCASRVALVTLVLACTQFSNAQGLLASLTGKVTDSTGAVVPGARVSLLNTATKEIRKAESSAAGVYALFSLPPGDYRLEVERAGFKKLIAEGITLAAGREGRMDLTLQLATVAEEVTVTDRPPVIETRTGMASTTVVNEEIRVLPLEGRNVMEIAMTMPGVTGEIGKDEGGIFNDTPSIGAGLSISGGRPGSSSFLTDGANSTGVSIARATVTFSPETVQEVQVITSSFSAKFGISGGGLIQTITKGGTDRLRGSAFWYHRNPTLAARKFGRVTPPHHRRQEFGATLGGPVVLPKVYNGRQRTFFFFSIEPKRFFDQDEILWRFPTAEERRGDFRNSYYAPGQTPALLYRQVECFPSEANCTQLRPLNRANATTLFPLFSANDPDPSKRGYVIPPAYLDPVAQLILKDVPLPNMPFNAQGQNFLGYRGVDGTDNRWNVRLDHNISSRNRLTTRYSEVPNQIHRFLAEKGSYFASIYSDRSLSRQWLLSDTHTISSHVVNEFRASYNFGDYSRLAPGDIGSVNYTKDKFGLPSQTDWGYPQFATGYATLGLQGARLGWNTEHQYQLSDDVMISHGRHTINIGMDLRLMMFNLKSSRLQGICCGSYTFSTVVTESGNANIPTGAGGSTFASFLTGVPSSVALTAVNVPYYYRWKAAAAYIQDDFRVKPGLTLNLGVRWQYDSPRYEKFNRQASIDLDHPVEIRSTNGTLQALTFNYLYSGIGGRSIYLEPAHKRNFEPRFGFAWSPQMAGLKSRSFAVRGGYGISAAPLTGRFGSRNPAPEMGSGAGGSWTYTRWVGAAAYPGTQTKSPNDLVSIGRNAPVINSNPIVLAIPAEGKLCHACSPVDARVPAGSLYTFAKDAKAPYIQTWNLTVQGELAANLVFSLGYMGQKGTHLYSPLVGINNPDAEQYQQLLNQGINPDETIPDPFGRVNTAGNLITTTRANLLRPFPAAGDILIAGKTDSNSIYHAGIATLERRFARGLGFRFNYTWGKSIDTTSDGDLDVNGNQLFEWGASMVQNANDLKNNRSVSLFDTRHRLNFSFTANLPIGRGKALDGGRFLNSVLGGWTVSGLGTIVSGIPFAPNLGLRDLNGIPGAISLERVRPDMVLGVPVINPRWSKSVANDVPYFNPEAFGRPAYRRYGTAPRTLDYARTPWKQTMNASVFREFHPFKTEGRSLQLRADFYNVLNHVTFTTITGANIIHLFVSAPPVCQTCTSLAGPMPYLFGRSASEFPVGSRENILAANYSQNFGKLWMNNNGPGRIIQFSLKLSF